MGWESCFSLPESTYILETDDLYFMWEPEVGGLFEEIVLISKFKAIVTLAGSNSYTEVVHYLQKFNVDNPKRAVRKILSNTGYQLANLGKMRGGGSGSWRPKSFPPPDDKEITVHFEGAGAEQMEELIAIFIHDGLHYLEKQGTPTIQAPTPLVHRARNKKPTSNSFILTFAYGEDSLLWYIRYKDHHWSTQQQSIIVKMDNDTWAQKTKLQEFQALALRTYKL